MPTLQNPGNAHEQLLLSAAQGLAVAVSPHLSQEGFKGALENLRSCTSMSLCAIHRKSLLFPFLLSL